MGPVPSTSAWRQHVAGVGGWGPRDPSMQPAPPPPPLRWGRGGDKGGPSAPAETLGQPPAGEGPQEQEAAVLLGASSEGARGAHGPGSSPGSARSRLGDLGARDLPFWASGSSSVNGWDGLEMDAQTPARVLTPQVPS